MNEAQLKQIWQTSNEKLDQCLTISRKNIEDITKIKVQSLLFSIKPIKLFTILIGSLWVVIGGIITVNLFINAYEKISPFFIWSTTLQLVITAISLLIYFYQITLIYQTDLSDPIVITQQRLTRLKSSSLWAARVIFLQLPLWTTFYWNKNMIQNANTVLWSIQIIITLLFTFAGVWLFFNINYNNREKKWFKFIFSGKEWENVIRAIELNNEVLHFKTEK